MFFVFVAVFVIIKIYSCNGNQIFHVALDEKGSVTLDWAINYENKYVTFEVHIPSNYSWFAFGFSDRGKLFPADYCLLWYNWHGEIQLEDVWADERGVLYVDHQQDCTKFQIKLRGNTVKYVFERQFDTCDNKDYIIEDGTTHLVWTRGTDRLYKINGLNISSDASNSGMVRVQLLKNTNVDMSLPSDAKTLNIRTNRVHVPADETTYWCHVHKLPEQFQKKHHVVQATIQKGNEGLIHHMEVFHCISPSKEEIPLYVGSCFASHRPKKTQVCKRVLAAWAMGAKPFQYPQEAGLPIGGPDFNPYLMLEVHYNNPEKRSDWIDSSGVQFHIVSKLRQADAGVIELGLEYTDKMAIPPYQEEFPLTGYCASECTAVSIPPQGIYIFGSQLHTHLTGARVVTRHIRNGRELPELNRDNHYSTHFQEIRRLKRLVNVLPGDALLTTCDYNTEDRRNVTLGGFAISDEMCVNYIHYFPVTPLEVCKSAISDQALSTFFEYMYEWEGQQTYPENPISENYKNIRWNRMRAQLLRNVYREAPLSMQCNMSSGDRFPGYWENTPTTPVLVPLPPPLRQCDQINTI